MKQEVIIKNMVCPRCIEAVQEIFKDLKLPLLDLQLGKATLATTTSPAQKALLQKRLQERGFEWLDDKQTQIINAIKSALIQQIHHSTATNNFNFSTLLTQELPYDYAYLSRLFSTVEGQTIERFVLAQKIEKVKELLTYGELSLSEIAFQMNYSSSAYLSAQFKKVTGMTPSAFKELHQHRRQSLDEL